MSDTVADFVFQHRRVLPAMSEVLLGTCGWSYAEWEGILYPQKQGKLKQCASIFPTAEIDSTFYRLPEPGTVLGWARQMHFSSVARSVLHTNFDGAVKRFMPT